MNFYNQPRPAVTAAGSMEYDAGLRAYMLRIYNYMASALTLTGLVAYAASQSPAFQQAMLNVQADGRAGLSLLGYIVLFAPLGIVFYLSARISSMSEAAAKTWFWVYSALVGLSLSWIFLAYTGESVARTFFITAGSFGAMSLYGYSTKKDLSPWGSFLIMGLFGIIIASVVNMFLGSAALAFAVSLIGVAVFAGLTAYDTQNLKALYYQSGVASNSKIAVMGALKLYLDFLNMFMFLLRFTGSRR